MSVSKYDIELSGEEDVTSHGLMLELVGANKRVLDVGCSTGYLAKALGEHANTVSGIEYDQASADKARPFLQDLVVGDLEDPGIYDTFADASFDVIVFGDVLEHLRDPLPVLRRARRLLSPGGSVVISVPNIAHGDVRLALLSGRFDYRDTGLLDETHVRFFTRANLDRFLREAGMRPVDVRTTTAPLFGTELGLDPGAFPADVVAGLQADPEASVYQFVLRAAPDDLVQAEAEVAWRLLDAQRRVAELAADLAAVRAEVDRLRVGTEQGVAERSELHRELAQAHRDRDDALERAAEAEQLLLSTRSTKSFRVAQVPSRLYGRLRG